MRPTILANGLVFSDGYRMIGSVVIDNGIIRDIPMGYLNLATIDRKNYNVVNCSGKMILPGVIDEHVHFREPGLTEKGNINSESHAALAGGVTTFFDMPNTNPATTTVEAWENKMERASEMSAINYAFYMGATASNLREIFAMDPTRYPGVKVFMGSSTGNLLLDNDASMQRLFSDYKGVISVHAECNSIIEQNVRRLNALYPDGIPLRLHHEVRSREACVEATRRAIGMARETGARLHVMHISTADELRFFKEGDVALKRITAETCPHYLMFTSDSVEQTGGLTKCNPAIKSDDDRRALIKAVADGRINTVATDHAPHQRLNKSGNALTAASGMPSVQFSLPIMLQMARKGYFSYETVVKCLCHNPAEIFNIDRRGALRHNYWADIVVVNPDTEYEITDEIVCSRCGWTPYAGTRLSFSVEQTWVNGVLAYDKGHFTDQQNPMPVRFNV